MRALVRCVDEVGAVILIPLVLAEPLLRTVAIPLHAFFSMEHLFTLAGAITKIQTARMRADFWTITKFSIICTWAVGNFRSLLVGVFADDVARWCVVADETMFVSSAATANVRTTHSRTFGPHKLSVVSALSYLSIFVAHWVASLSCEVITLTLVVPKLYGPHEPFNGAGISIPEEDVLSYGVLFQIPQRIRFVPQVALARPIPGLQGQFVIPIHLLHVSSFDLRSQIIVLLQNGFFLARRQFFVL